MNTRLFAPIAIAALVLGLGASTAAAQSTHFDIELGYQGVDVDGNEDLYRTQINQRDGFVLRGLSIHHINPTDEAKIADNFRIDAAGFGGNPAGRFRLWAGLGKIYRLRLFYSQFENFSALPAFANPEIEDGVVPGQHTWDRDRQTIDIELELLPNRTITPLIGYRRNEIDGPRRTTYRVGENEYRLDSELTETEDEIYAGFTFKAGSVFGTLIQGWRQYTAEDRLSLAPDESNGNVDVPLLGVEQYLDDFSRNMRTEAETPVTTVNIQGRIIDALGFAASYVRADIEGEASSAEMLSGSLVSYRISRFFQGLDQDVSSRTDNPYWRGEGRLDVHFTDSVRLDLHYQTSHRSLEGWSLISNLYLDTLNFAGFDPRDIETMIEVNNGFDRQDDQITARLNVSDVGPIVLWAEYGKRDTDLTVDQDLSQIVVPGGQAGSYERSTDLIGAGASILIKDSRISFDVTTENADNVIVRTDFNDRLRLRGRLDLALASWFRALVTAEHIELNNSTSGVGYESNTDHFALDLNFNPTENLTFRLAWDSFDNSTEMPILIPQTLTEGRSEFMEEGTLLEGGLLWRISRFTIDLGYSEFENTGSFEFDSTRAFLRFGVDFTDHWAAAFEYENNEYEEEVLDLAQFDATRYGIYVRWHR
jgi:hypothetical protein